MARRTRVLVTGAGGPAGMGTIRSLLRAPAVDVVAADMSRLAPGLYWARERAVIPPARDPSFVRNLLAVCKRLGVEMLFPTVDEEVSVLSSNMSQLHGKVK